MRHGWSLDKGDWDVLRQCLLDKQWREVSFMTQSTQSTPSQPGAYLIAAPSPLSGQPVLAELRCPLYAGHTDDLRRRLREQLNERRYLMTTFSRMVFLYCRTDSVDTARQLEQALLVAFGPPDNHRHSILMGRGRSIPAGRPRNIQRRN